MATRPVQRLVKAKPTIEGAGVRLRRAFGFGATNDYDPFLLLDDFRNERPEDYKAGFPWHPHRGIETITYVLAGTVEHGDNMGNRGSIGAGDIQWMTAGRGIVHQEMPAGDAQGRMHGFQLWANLPSALKMTAPRYQDVKAKDVPVARGGTDTAPSPYELLLAALASCTSITLRMYAERKQWTLGAIQVEASYHLEGKEGRITRVVSFGEALGEEQRARLAEIAEKTPVTRALKAGVPIATTLRSADQTGEP